ncbi:MAG: ATP-grasp domain-containing protein [Candidatus Promineifilaceae bacterium]
MNAERAPTILCLAGYFKGEAFLEACKDLGCHVILITKEKLADEDWPMHAIDERFLMADISKRPDILHAVSYLARSRHIDRIIALDDFDVETVAALREHLRIPGMGDTTARYFRDKLAMRVQARELGILVPDFSPVFNYEDLRAFSARVAPPWVLKPRSQAGAMGIKKVQSEAELWSRLEELGDDQSFFLLERFVAGDIFHVDSIVSEREPLFMEVHKYKQPPLAVSHEGGVFMTRTLPREAPEVGELRELNARMLKAMGMVRGVTHAEFIRGADDGRFYFLETAARVGGANIADMVEFATGINLWREWAAIELDHLRGREYQLPPTRADYAGLLICLARQERPDLSLYQAPEVVWRLRKKHHAGLIVASEDQSCVEQRMDEFSPRFAADFLATAPPLESAPE